MNIVMRHTNSSSLKTALFAALATALITAPAMAADFDGTEIVTKVVAYTAVGVLILGAFALGRWTLRAMGLIGGK